MRSRQVDEDGRVYIVQHPNTKNWIIRVRLEGERGYRKKTSSTDDDIRATQRALSWYHELNGLIKAGIKLDGTSFSYAAEAWCEKLNDDIAHGDVSLEVANSYRGIAGNYFIPFFGDKQIDTISAGDIEEYRAWRKNYWVTGPGKDIEYDQGIGKNGRKYKRRVRHSAPSVNSQRLEGVPLRAIFRFAERNGWVETNRQPEIKDPTPRVKDVKNRSALSPAQYQALLEALDPWIEAAAPQQLYYRVLMKFWLSVMVGTGMRVGKESSNIKWKDFQFELAPNSNRGAWRLVIREGKTVSSRRKIVMGAQPVQALNEWKSISKFTEPDDFIFCSPDGSPLRQMRKTFQSLCEFAGVTEDAFGRKFTPYCLRHTYITFMLREGVDVWKISKNSGNSPETIRRFYAHDQTMDYIDELAGDETRTFLGPKTISRHPPDDIQIRGNRITVPPPRERHPFRSHPRA